MQRELFLRRSIIRGVCAHVPLVKRRQARFRLPVGGSASLCRNLAVVLDKDMRCTLGIVRGTRSHCAGRCGHVFALAAG